MGLPSPWPTITALASSQQAKKSVTLWVLWASPPTPSSGLQTQGPLLCRA